MKFKNILSLGAAAACAFTTLQGFASESKNEKGVWASSRQLSSKEIHSLFKKYKELFLPPYQKFVLAGQPSKARSHAAPYLQENQVYQKMKPENLPILYGPLDQQYYNYLSWVSTRTLENFHPFHYRKFNGSKYEKKLNENIHVYKTIYKINEEETLQALARGEKRGSLKDKEVEKLTNKITKFSTRWNSLQETNRGYESFGAIATMIEPLINFQTSSVPQHGKSFSKKSINALKEKVQAEVKAKHLEKSTQRKINTLFLKIRSINSLIADINELDPNEKYTSLEKSTINAFNKMKEQYPETIARATAQLKFVQENPDFFKTEEKSRLSAIGASSWGDKIKKGDDIIVGVIDTYDYCPDSVLLKQCLNPDYNPNDCLNIETTFDSHALHVAGIVLSQQMSTQDQLPLGIAPNAQYYMVRPEEMHLSREIVKSMPEGSLMEKEWEVEQHIKMIDLFTSQDPVSLFYPSTGEEMVKLTWRKDQYKENKLLSTLSTPLYNISLGGARFEAPHTYQLSSPELGGILAYICSQPKSLFCIALGNNGIELSSSKIIGRAWKALSAHSKTKSCVLFGAALLEDGMNLWSDSNVPGDDVNLQKRTLSAVGANVESACFQYSPWGTDRGLMSGTSMATPKLTGVAAVVLSNYEKLTNDQLASCLLKGATPLLYDANHLSVIELTGYTAGHLNKVLKKHPQGIEISAEQFITSSSYYKPESITVDQNLWQESQRLYGQGRVNLSGALQYAEEIF